MPHLLWVPLAASLLLTALGPPLVTRLAPRRAYPALTLVAVISAATWVYGWALVALVGLGQLPVVASLGRWSAASVRADQPLPAWVGALAVTVVTSAGAAGAAAATGRLTALLAAERLVNRDPARRLLLLPDELPDAFTVGGITGGRIAVSVGMLRVLDDRERAAMLAHEQAHVDGRHHLPRLVVSVCAAVDPLLRHLPARTVVLTERAADEVAAAAVGDRQLVARALARAAVARQRHAHPTSRSAVAPAFGVQDVSARVRALLAPAPSHSLGPLLPLVPLVLAAALLTVETSRAVEQVFELARLHG